MDDATKTAVPWALLIGTNTSAPSFSQVSALEVSKYDSLNTGGDGLGFRTGLWAGQGEAEEVLEGPCQFPNLKEVPAETEEQFRAGQSSLKATVKLFLDILEN